MGRIAIGLTIGCLLLFTGPAGADVGAGAGTQPGVGVQPGTGLGTSPITPAPPDMPNPAPPIVPQQPGIAPGLDEPATQPPYGTSCASEMSSTPGFLCPEPGTLPGSNNPPAVTPPENTAPFEGMQSSPTNPGAVGNAPGESGSPYGNDGQPFSVGPSQSQGAVAPATGGP
jgi:hypothetical protein